MTLDKDQTRTGIATNAGSATNESLPLHLAIAKTHQARSEVTRQRILDAARSQFVSNGLEGTRMEAIAAAAGVNKSLVYRHFGNRERLYRHVIRNAYADVRRAEANLELSEDPLQALNQLVSFTLHYYVANPDFLVLVGIENLHKAEHLAQIGTETLLISSLRDILAEIIARGMELGLFRDCLKPDNLYMMISGLCWFTVATTHTFGIAFEIDVLAPEALLEREDMIKESVRRFVLIDPVRIGQHDGGSDRC